MNLVLQLFTDHRHEKFFCHRFIDRGHLHPDAKKVVPAPLDCCLCSATSAAFHFCGWLLFSAPSYCSFSSSSMTPRSLNALATNSEQKNVLSSSMSSFYPSTYLSMRFVVFLNNLFPPMLYFRPTASLKNFSKLFTILSPLSKSMCLKTNFS